MAHTIILGRTGSGKSFLLNFLITNLQKYQPHTFIFDLGGSFESLTHLFDGSYVRIGLESDDFSINSIEAFITTFTRVGRMIASVGLFITGLSLFVGGIGIMNIMFVSVSERTREIGIRKAIGAKRRTILIQFLIEAAVICMIGGLIGLGLAALATWGISRVFPASLSVSIAALALAVSALTGIIAGFLPAWRAARMNPVDALRAE